MLFLQPSFLFLDSILHACHCICALGLALLPMPCKLLGKLCNCVNDLFLYSNSEALPQESICVCDSQVRQEGSLCILFCRGCLDFVLQKCRATARRLLYRDFQYAVPDQVLARSCSDFLNLFSSRGPNPNCSKAIRIATATGGKVPRFQSPSRYTATNTPIDTKATISVKISLQLGKCCEYVVEEFLPNSGFRNCICNSLS